ncbi:uncharacterized protein LOC128985160 [Macrosteles quadrilineatus]|uniref:uncharacterized protein LOC128985160 n=1 Tax=Macrosteles quadrilineatus TaxID=74068 RepID=UPI0023E19BD9|nr:uncharacterized protein LOC128985160 [Macrosteles quadrilineatus]
MSRARSVPADKAGHGIKVRVHNTVSVPLVQPRSPDMIPAFAGIDNGDADKSMLVKRNRKMGFQVENPLSRSRNIREEPKKLNRNSKKGPGTISIPLNINKKANTKVQKASTFSNLNVELNKPTRKAFTAREQGDEKNVKDLLKKFLDSDFPPYNPEDFTPKDNSVSEGDLGNSELLQNIRQELDEWLSKCPEENKKKDSCPEMWSSVPSTCMYTFKLRCYSIYKSAHCAQFTQVNLLHMCVYTEIVFADELKTHCTKVRFMGGSGEGHDTEGAMKQSGEEARVQRDV